MAWLDVEWTHGDAFSAAETPLDQMADNLEFLRDEQDYRGQISGAGWSWGAHKYDVIDTWGANDFRVKVLYGSQIDTAIGSTYGFDESWNAIGPTVLDVSGLSDYRWASPQFLVQYRRGGGGSWLTHARLGRFVFFKTPEVDELRVELEVQGEAGRSAFISDPLYGLVRARNAQVTGQRSSGDSSWTSVNFSGDAPASELNDMIDNSFILRDNFAISHILGTCLVSTNYLTPQWSLGSDDVRLVLHVGGIEATSTVEFGPGVWTVVNDPANLWIGSLPNWTLSTVRLYAEIKAGTQWTREQGTILSGVFVKLPDMNFASLRGHFHYLEEYNAAVTYVPGNRPYDPMGRSLWCEGCGVVASRTTITP